MSSKWDLKRPGHICIYGGSFTGKTVFMRYLTDKYIKAGHYERKDVYVFTTHPQNWTDFNNVYVEWAKIKDVKRQIVTGARKGLLLFDDFNEKVDTRHDKIYNQLFTAGRHSGIRIMTVAHKTTAIGKSARESLGYVVIGFSSNEAYINELAKYYFMNNNYKLKQLVLSLMKSGKYTKLVIDKYNNEMFNDKAPDPEVSDVVAERPCGDTMGGDNMGGGGNTSASANFVSNKNNVMHDNSNTTNVQNVIFNHKVEIKKRLLKQVYDHKIRMKQIELNEEFSIQNDKVECEALCYKKFKTNEEIDRHIELLNKLMIITDVNRTNLPRACKKYMSLYKPGRPYNPPKEVFTLMPMRKDVYRKDYSKISQNILEYAVSSQIGKKLLSYF